MPSEGVYRILPPANSFFYALRRDIIRGEKNQRPAAISEFEAIAQSTGNGGESFSGESFDLLDFAAVHVADSL